MDQQQQQEIDKMSKILSSLTSSSLERQRTIDKIKSLIIKDHHQSSPSLSPTTCSSILQSLLGILRCSNESSLLISACQLLSTLTHSCDEMRIELGKLKVISILLPLLDTPTPITYERVWEWVPVQEQVLATIRKATFCSEINQSSFMKDCGTTKLVKICQQEKGIFPPKTKQRLQELMVDQLLIAAVSPVSKSDKDKMVSQFPVLSLLKTVNYPMYYVDLADERKAWLTDTLIKEGLGLPDAHSLLKEEGVAWIIVKGTRVTGPTAVWLQYSVDKKSSAIHEMFLSLRKLKFPSPPLSGPLSLGSVYAVYVGNEERREERGKEKQRERERREERRGSWYRGWLIELPSQPHSNPTFFCMDYGFTVTIATPGHVTELPQECRGVPPQAVPCILGGICPPPKSYTIQRHVSAILCNLAFTKEINRREIAAVGGAQLLLELITSLDSEVQCNALEALVNLGQSKEVCQLLRQLGAIQTLTDLCILFKGVHKVMVSKLCLGVLKNLLIHDPVKCIEVCGVFNVYDRLKEWREREDGELREFIHHVLTAIESIQKGIMPVIPTNEPLLTCAPFPKSPHPPPPLATDQSITESMKSLPNSNNNNNSKTMPKIEATPPVYRVLSQSQRSIGSTHSKPDPVLSPKINVLTFNKGQEITREERKGHVHFIDIRCVKTLMDSIKGVILKSMCALGNEEDGGCMYIGAAGDRGIVHGIKMSRGEKDLFCIVFDGAIMSCVEPPFDNRYTVSFHPVLLEGGSDHAHNSTHCIIQVNVIPSPTNALHLIVMKREGRGRTESCFISRNGHSVKIDFLECQQLVKSREIRKYEQILVKQ